MSKDGGMVALCTDSHADPHIYIYMYIYRMPFISCVSACIWAGFLLCVVLCILDGYAEMVCWSV